MRASNGAASHNPSTLIQTMGSSPSKVDNGFDRPRNNQTKEHNSAKKSSSDESGGTGSYTHDSANRQESSDSDQEEKKEMETISTTTPTPRAKHTMRSSEGAGRATEQVVPEGRDDGPPRRARIRDEHVHVNLAMADLMAYLQVVANNSNNLPLTRRDDPELSRMVSNLTSEEYARKSAAFIPADVRVIGGSFTKYGRVWDLPTSEEYNAQDGAQEPGRSYGGACCNAMLKVLYDAANEAADAAQTGEQSGTLFDDDDDEEATLSGGSFSRNKSFTSLDLNDHGNTATISWATLMKKMKSEVRDIEYAQVPTLTSTRKLDLNQPFSLVPETFDPKTCKRRSLLVGCNYNHMNGAQLKASHDDVRSMKDYIVNVHGFSESDDMMTVLLDDDKHQHPTFLNITEAFKALSEQSQPGDAVFIHFSGHGGRILDSNEDAEGESYDEVVVPSDYTTSGLVRDTLIFKTLLAPMRYGVTVTVLIDACDTGMVLDLPYSWSPRSGSACKMTQNDDFSFVRFLKVVKTLYESSTFTQLGRTVGSALNSGNNAQKEDYDKEDDITNDDADGSKDSRPFSCGGDGNTNNQLQTRTKGFLSMFCGTPTAGDEAPRKKKKFRDDGTLDTGDARHPSLFEKMISCTLGEEVDLDDMSDYDSFGNGAPTFSDREYQSEESFDDARESRRHRGSRGDRGRSRGRRK